MSTIYVEMFHYKDIYCLSHCFYNARLSMRMVLRLVRVELVVGVGRWREGRVPGSSLWRN